MSQETLSKNILQNTTNTYDKQVMQNASVKPL